MINMTVGWIDADAAIARLGVRPQTLYAYVSRGRLGVRKDPNDPRRSLYAEKDVERLAERRRVGRGPEAVAASAISWGEPVLASKISTVKDGRLFYRGVDAVTLSKTASFEAAAALLLDCPEKVLRTARAPGGAMTLGAEDGEARRARPYLYLGSLAARADPILGRAPASLTREAASLLRGLVGVFAEGADPDAPAAFAVAGSWGRPDLEGLFRRVLVLLAEHELNVSAFAVRVAASSGAPLPACLLAGLATLSGPLHGLVTLGVFQLIDEAAVTGPGAALRRRLQEGAPAAGFGHPLYAGMDPRASALLADVDMPPAYAALARAAEEILGLAPNVDFVLAALVARFELSRGAPFRLFALARSAGWLAHAVEQQAMGGLIRPRARYIGPPPGTPA
jgi:citrate synthase